MKSISGGVASLGAVTALILAVPACGVGSTAGSQSTQPPSHPVTTPAAAVAEPVVTGCSAPPGYTIDGAHSGTLTAHNYSAAADVQAALEFDQMSDGARDVYLRHSADGRVDSVISCVAMPFPSEHVANRFFMSYRALRHDAGSLVHRITLAGPASGLVGVTAYLERGQSFRGYRIADTKVIEAAGRDGSRLDIVSVSGSSPSRALAGHLLAAMAAA